MDFILKSNYPKEYLAAPVAEITHFERYGNLKVEYK